MNANVKELLRNGKQYGTVGGEAVSVAKILLWNNDTAQRRIDTDKTEVGKAFIDRFETSSTVYIVEDRCEE